MEKIGISTTCIIDVYFKDEPYVTGSEPSPRL